jgi:tellurite resistance protein TehA-like permease
MNVMKKNFSPLLFLASLGAGGIAVIPFAFLNYTFPHPKGLINIMQVHYDSIEIWQAVLFRFLEITMILFTLIHIVLSIILFVKLIGWMKNSGYKHFIDDPLTNSAIMSPYISIVMTMNVFIGPVRYFIPSFADNLQVFMLPALIFWAIIWLFLMRMEIKLLRISFEKSFDITKIHFGWLLHPFALGMLTVTGTGIAALSHDASVAHTAAFMSLISGSMGFFLLIVKMITLFKSHFAAKGMPERQFLPSFLIVIPNITLYAISAFRLGHYLEHQHNAEMGSYFLIVMVLAFAFETWYLAFGLSLLRDYFKKHFAKEFYVSQWGLVCPVVAYAVLGSFVYKVFVPNLLLYILIIFVLLISVILFFVLLKKQITCSFNKKLVNDKLLCR